MIIIHFVKPVNKCCSCETIVLMIAVGLAEPLLADPDQIFPKGAPTELLALGPLHVSEDAVQGSEECARFFPPGYSEPERKAKSKSKKKKKKRSKDDSGEPTEHTQSQENADQANGDENGGEEGAEGDDNGDGDDEENGNGGTDSDEQLALDKATSPLPLTPH